jgi:alpha-N-acetylglucosamine transferase
MKNNNSKWFTIISLLVLVFIIVPIVLNMFGYKLTENFNQDISSQYLDISRSLPPVESNPLINMENANMLQTMIEQKKNELSNAMLQTDMNKPIPETFSLLSDLNSNSGPETFSLLSDLSYNFFN